MPTVFGRDYPTSYDAIIIGSGIGGLFCGNILAKAGLKVLLLERHYIEYRPVWLDLMYFSAKCGR